MDRKHIKFSVDAQEYQKLLKEENEELKEKIICLESDACNEVSQAQFDDAMEDKDIEIKKLQEENEELKKNEGWWRHEIVKLLGWDEKEGAKWNSPYEHDVKVRDIFETLEGYIFAVRGGNQHDCETGEVNGYSPSLKQIKKENEKLNIKLKNSAKITKFVQKKVEKLKEENEELKKDIFTQHAEYGTFTDIKKIDVLRKQYMDFYNCLDQDDLKGLGLMNGEPLEHRDYIFYLQDKLAGRWE
jgi:FtsZ-binding cell division protein ZapB